MGSLCVMLLFISVACHRLTGGILASSQIYLCVLNKVNSYTKVYVHILEYYACTITSYILTIRY